MGSLRVASLLRLCLSLLLVQFAFATSAIARNARSSTAQGMAERYFPLKDLTLTCRRSRSTGLRARESKCRSPAFVASLVYILPRFVPDIIERPPNQHSQLLARRDQHPPRSPLRSIDNARPLLLSMARQVHNGDRLDSSRHVDLRFSYPLVALSLALLHDAGHI